MYFRHELAIYGNGLTITDPSGVHARPQSLTQKTSPCFVEDFAAPNVWGQGKVAGLLGNGRAAHSMTRILILGIQTLGSMTIPYEAKLGLSRGSQCESPIFLYGNNGS